MDTTDDFTAAYAAYWDPATRLARGMTRDHASAEDLAAEGLLRIWHQWDAGRVEQPWGYVRRTIVNATIDRARKHSREQAALARYEPPAPVSDESAIVNRDLVLRLLDELPPVQRRIIELRFLHDLTERQTAEELGISVGAVKSGTSRGLARLRSSHAGEATLALAA